MEGKKYKNLVNYKKMVDKNFRYIMLVYNLQLKHSVVFLSGQLQYGYDITHFNLIFCLQYTWNRICGDHYTNQHVDITFCPLSLFKIKKDRANLEPKSPNCDRDKFSRKTIEIIFKYLLTLFIV